MVRLGMGRKVIHRDQMKVRAELVWPFAHVNLHPLGGQDATRLH
jgi:hypothetical protein